MEVSMISSQHGSSCAGHHGSFRHGATSFTEDDARGTVDWAKRGALHLSVWAVDWVDEGFWASISQSHAHCQRCKMDL